jgi:hypothetical protein
MRDRCQRGRCEQSEDDSGLHRRGAFVQKVM